MKMLCVGLAYIQAAQLPVCLVTTPTPSCSAAAVIQNQTDSFLLLASVTTGTIVVMVVMAQMVTSPPVFNQTVSVNSVIIHNLCKMTSDPEALMARKLWIQRCLMLSFMGHCRNMSLKGGRRVSTVAEKKTLFGLN